MGLIQEFQKLYEKPGFFAADGEYRRTIKKIEKEGNKKSPHLSGEYYRFPNTSKKVIDGFEVFKTFIRELKQHLQEDGGNVILYRCVSANDIDLGRAGVYWSYRRTGAKCYWAGSKLEKAVIEAEVPISSIDLWASLVINLVDTVDKWEIRLKNRAHVKVLKIHRGKKNVLKRPLRTRASR